MDCNPPARYVSSAHGQTGYLAFTELVPDVTRMVLNVPLIATATRFRAMVTATLQGTRPQPGFMLPWFTSACRSSSMVAMVLLLVCLPGSSLMLPALFWWHDRRKRNVLPLATDGSSDDRAEERCRKALKCGSP